MSPLGKGKTGAELSALGSQPLTQRERRAERERVRKWGPMRAIEKIVKADQTRECSRVLFECGHEATVMKTLTTRARCFLCRPGRPEAEADRPGQPRVEHDTTRPGRAEVKTRARPPLGWKNRRDGRHHPSKHGLIALQHAARDARVSRDRCEDERRPRARRVAHRTHRRPWRCRERLDPAASRGRRRGQNQTHPGQCRRLDPRPADPRASSVTLAAPGHPAAPAHRPLLPAFTPAARPGTSIERSPCPCPSISPPLAVTPSKAPSALFPAPSTGRRGEPSPLRMTRSSRRRNPGAQGAQQPVHATLRASRYSTPPVSVPPELLFEGRPRRGGSCASPRVLRLLRRCSPSTRWPMAPCPALHARSARAETLRR